MTFLKWFLLSLSSVVLMTSCTRNSDNTDPSTTTPKPSGAFYLAAVDTFKKINAADGTLMWAARIPNYGASAGNPIIVDSTTFYFGNDALMEAFSTQTGQPTWYFILPIYAGFGVGFPYCEISLKDSLAYFTSATSILSQAFLYCANKSTGQSRWSARISDGDATKGFYSLAKASGDKVVAVTRDYNLHKHLTGFNGLNGTQLWTTTANDSLTYKFLVSNGRAYFTNRRKVESYTIADGSLAWQTTLPIAGGDHNWAFAEGNKLVLVRATGTAHDIFTLDASSGAVLNRTTLNMTVLNRNPSAVPISCCYRDNNVYLIDRYAADTVSIKSYDLSTSTLKWEKHFPDGYVTQIYPILTDKYLLVPRCFLEGSRLKYSMDFYDLRGNLVHTVPYYVDNSETFTYVENGVVYRQNGPGWQ